MAKRLLTIYELLKEYNEKEIDYVINFQLSKGEKNLLDMRYGQDLHNPVTSKEFTPEMSKQFYSILLPKIKRFLVRNRGEKIADSLNAIFNEAKVETSASVLTKVDLKETIYDLFKGYTKDEVNNVIKGLSKEEKDLINDRYGDDLEHPVDTGRFDKTKKFNFYHVLVPKMKSLLMENRKKVEEELKKLNKIIGEERIKSAKNAEKEKMDLAKKAEEERRETEAKAKKEKKELTKKVEEERKELTKKVEEERKELARRTEEERKKLREEIENERRELAKKTEEERRKLKEELEKEKRELARKAAEERKTEIESAVKTIIDEKNIKELELKKELIQLMKTKKTNIEICSTLGINSEKLCKLISELNDSGILLSRNYYSDGSIKYGKIYSLGELQKETLFNQYQTIITEPGENKLKCLVISDLHVGNELEGKITLEHIADYIINNNIHIVFFCGDMLDGNYTMGKQIITDLYEQVESFLNIYPQIDGVLTFGVGGDHDKSLVSSEGINLASICNSTRHDIIMPGYNNACVSIKNDLIQMYHHIDGGQRRVTVAPIILTGGTHTDCISFLNNILNVSVPSLSTINQPFPGALEMNLTFDKGYIKNAGIKRLVDKKKIETLYDYCFDLSLVRDINQNGKINNEEVYRRVLK